MADVGSYVVVLAAGLMLLGQARRVLGRRSPLPVRVAPPLTVRVDAAPTGLDSVDDLIADILGGPD